MSRVKVDDDVDLYYLENGDPEDETVVFIHGLGANHNIWYSQARILEGTHHIVRYDIRGAGLSSKPEGGYSLSTWSEDMVDLLEELQVERTHIVGHSLGAMIALHFALDHSDQVLSLVLAGGFLELDEETREMIEGSMEVVREEGIEPTADEEGIQGAFAPKTVGARPEILGLHRGLSLAEDPVGYLGQCRGVLRSSLKGKIGGIESPVLLLVGSHDRLTPLENTLEIASELEDAEVEVIANAGHMAMVERPQRFSELLLTFFS